jgi:hypothetical protein
VLISLEACIEEYTSQPTTMIESILNVIERNQIEIEKESQITGKGNNEVGD